MTNHGGAREGAGRKPRQDGRERRHVSVNLTEEEYEEIMGLDIEKRRKRLMLEFQTWAEDIYDAQSITATEYPSAEAYADDLMDLAEQQEWTNDLTDEQKSEARQSWIRWARQDRNET